MRFVFKRKVFLAPLSTFKIGGRAEYFLRVKKPENLIEAIQWAKDKKIPHKVFAGGSNILFLEGKRGGLFIQFLGGGLEIAGKKFLVDAGVPLETVIKKSISLGLAGLESLSGVPGTIGGAIIGNAGAYGHSVSEAVEKVEIWDGKKRKWLKNNDCKFSYRESIFKKKSYILLRAVLNFNSGDENKLKRVSKEIIKIRAKKYNSKINCPGSFFKNVLSENIPREKLGLIDKSKIIDGKIPAGYLLEQVGALGMRVGKIKVADFHGNLLMNLGGGSAKDVKKLASILKARVKNKFGVKLEEEIRYF